jgi:D-xylose 1-dehydrogenase (NADP+, D-xylono-1,5-lactone-forming)
VGNLGTIIVSDPWHCDEPRLTVSLQGGASRDIPVPQANSYQLELEEFAKAVRGERHRLLGREDALGQARAVDALFLAAQQASVRTLTRER